MAQQRRVTTILLALGVGLAVSVGGAVAEGPGAKAVAARQAKFKELGGAFKTINDQLKTDAPDKAAIAASAKKMQALAAAEASWFPRGSGPEAGVKTAAKSEIWSDAPGFAAAVKTLQAETGKLNTLAAAGDLDGVKAQTRAVGGACKACHDKYRVPQK